MTRWAGVLFLLLWIPAGHCTEPPAPIRTVTISAIINEQTHAMVKDVLRVAYRRLGVGVVFDDLPGKRALEWASSGLTDGDAARIKGTEETYPNLVRVDVPVVYFKGVAFSKTLQRRIGTWEDLRGLRIGVVRGIRYATIGTEGMAPYFANDMAHLFTILDKGRIEVAVAVLDAGNSEIETKKDAPGIRRDRPGGPCPQRDPGKTASVLRGPQDQRRRIVQNLYPVHRPDLRRRHSDVDFYQGQPGLYRGPGVFGGRTHHDAISGIHPS